MPTITGTESFSQNQIWIFRFQTVLFGSLSFSPVSVLTIPTEIDYFIMAKCANEKDILNSGYLFVKWEKFDLKYTKKKLNINKWFSPRIGKPETILI